MSGTPSQKDAAKVDEKLLLDWGARIGAAAYSERIASSQLEELIASLDSVQGREALLVTAAFAWRQAQRLKAGRTTARLVSQAMLELYEKGYKKEEARKMLDFAKWVYAAVSEFRGFRGRPEQLTLESLLRQLAGGR